MATTTWTPAVLSKMKQLLQKGMSTAEIGKKIGMSKNAVVGKLNRLGWAAGKSAAPVAKPIVPTKKLAAEIAKKKPVKKAPAPKAAAKKPAPTLSRGAAKKATPKELSAHQRIIQHALDLASLKSDQCRWPIGDPDSDNFRFCGEQVFVGKPYCYEHCKMAYQFVPPKKK